MMSLPSIVGTCTFERIIAIVDNIFGVKHFGCEYIVQRIKQKT